MRNKKIAFGDNFQRFSQWYRKESYTFLYQKKALTLIELLIATSIFVVVMVTVYSSFSSGVFGYRNIEDAINVYQSARQVLGRMDLDLRNSFAYSADETKFQGNANDIEFITLVDTFKKDKTQRDYAFVSYKVDQNKLMRLCRTNQASLNQKSEIEADEMASDLEAITFSFGEWDSTKKLLTWKDSWVDPKIFPVAVKVKLTLKNKTKAEFERIIYLPSAQ